MPRLATAATSPWMADSSAELSVTPACISAERRSASRDCFSSSAICCSSALAWSFAYCSCASICREHVPLSLRFRNQLLDRIVLAEGRRARPEEKIGIALEIRIGTVDRSHLAFEAGNLLLGGVSLRLELRTLRASLRYLLLQPGNFRSDPGTRQAQLLRLQVERGLLQILWSRTLSIRRCQHGAGVDALARNRPSLNSPSY